MKESIPIGWLTTEEIAPLFRVQAASVLKQVSRGSYPLESKRYGRRRLFPLVSAWKLHSEGVEEALLPTVVRAMARSYKLEDSEQLERWVQSFRFSDDAVAPRWEIPMRRAIIPLWVISGGERVTLDFRNFALSADLEDLLIDDPVFRATIDSLLWKVLEAALWSHAKWMSTSNQREYIDRWVILEACRKFLNLPETFPSDVRKEAKPDDRDQDEVFDVVMFHASTTMLMQRRNEAYECASRYLGVIERTLSG